MGEPAQQHGQEAQQEENIKVCVRFRPVNSREKRASAGGRAAAREAEGGPQPWRWDKGSVLALFPITRGERSRQRTIERYGDGAAGTGTEPTEFLFDRVYGTDESTEALYDEVMQDLVNSAMRGKHCAAFAFGQTSTGKTYTMQGTSEYPGVIPRAVHDVFRFVDAAHDREFLLRVSYLEVYNESINDLFEPLSTNLRVFEDPRRGPVVQGLEEKIVVTPEQVFALISSGEAQRHIGSTDYNSQSSRSHTIFRIVIESKAKDATRARVATLNLVDLAGSEAAQTTQTRERRQEGSNINKSLLTLTHVIYKLSEKKHEHIPYRDSKLTRILQPSLQGNSRVAIVCTVTPWAGATEETLNTLRFATRAKKVRRAVHVNEVLDERALLLKYKQEIADLRAKLAAAESRTAPAALPAGATSPTAPASDDRVRAQIDEAIRNLNRVILNSGLGSSAEVKPPGTPERERAPQGSRELMDVSTPFFRKMARLDRDLERFDAVASLGRIGRAQSLSDMDVLSPDRGQLAALSKDSVVRRNSLDQLPGTLGSEAPTASPAAAPAPPSDVTSELRSIRQQLSALLQADAGETLGHQQQEGDDVTHAGDEPGLPDAPEAGASSEPDESTHEYVAALEQRVMELERTVAKQALEQSVGKADRSFLEKLLAEKDATIAEWSRAIADIEARQQQLEDENARLRVQLNSLQPPAG